jgi:hypothetical protein
MKKEAQTGMPACYNETPIYYDKPKYAERYIDPCDPDNLKNLIPSKGEARVIEFFRKAGISVQRREIGYIDRFGNDRSSLKSDMSAIANVLQINYDDPNNPFVIMPNVLIPFEVWGHAGPGVQENRKLTEEALKQEQTNRAVNPAQARLSYVKALMERVAVNPKEYAFKRALKEVMGTYLFQMTGATVIGLEVSKIARPDYIPDVLNQNLVIYNMPNSLELWDGNQPSVPNIARDFIQAFNVEYEELSLEMSDGIYNDYIDQYEQLLINGGKHLDAMLDRGQLDDMYSVFALVEHQNAVKTQIMKAYYKDRSIDSDLWQEATQIRRDLAVFTDEEAMGQFKEDVQTRTQISPELVRILSSANTLEAGMSNKERLKKEIDKWLVDKIGKMNPEDEQWLTSLPEYKKMRQDYDVTLNDIEQFHALMETSNDIHDQDSKDMINKINDDLTRLELDMVDFKNNGVLVRFFMRLKQTGQTVSKAKAVASTGITPKILDEFFKRRPELEQYIQVKGQPSGVVVDAPAPPVQDMGIMEEAGFKVSNIHITNQVLNIKKDNQATTPRFKR